MARVSWGDGRGERKGRSRGNALYDVGGGAEGGRGREGREDDHLIHVPRTLYSTWFKRIERVGQVIGARSVPSFG